MKVLIVLAVAFLVGVQARGIRHHRRHHGLRKSVQFTDCGSQGGTIHQVMITPCSSEPCAFKRGDAVSVEVDFTSSVTSANATFSAEATILGQNLPLTLPQPNACDLPNTKCPLTPGTDYEPAENVVVPQNIPPVFFPFPLQVKLTGDNNLEMLCGEVKVKIS